MFSSRFKKFSLTVAVISASILATAVYANHSWGGYHWARTINPFILKIGDNVSLSWKPYLATTSTDWSLSEVLDTVIVPGATKGNCLPTKGRVEVCSKKYGNNGWLGIAQVWVNSTGHIAQGIVKMNDTYFTTATYNTPAWKNLVMCQEVGHTLGLDHQDENFTNPNFGTCMDYTNNPLTNQHPNQHDYDQLVAMYTHLDTTNTLLSTALPHGNSDQVNADNPSSWGKSLRKDGKGRDSVYGVDLGRGEKLFTFVVWAN